MYKFKSRYSESCSLTAGSCHTPTGRNAFGGSGRRKSLKRVNSEWMKSCRCLPNHVKNHADQTGE